MKVSLASWKRQNVPSKMFLFFYTDGCLSAIQWMTKLKYIDCLVQYESSNVLNGTLSRQYFTWKMKQC